MKYIKIAINNNRIGTMQLREDNLRYFIHYNVNLSSRKKHYSYENKGYVARDYHNNEKFLTKSLLKSKVN